MKKLLVICALLAGMSAIAQQRGDYPHARNWMKDMTPEQMATLSSKRMALSLDLSEDQVKKVKALELQKAQERKSLMAAHRKSDQERQAPSAEERYNMLNNRLDNALAYQDAMKQILSEEQFANWKKWQAHRGSRFQKMKRHHRPPAERK